MNYELAGTVLDWIEKPSNECDRTKLFDVLNRIRERMYMMYSKVPLFDLTECFEVQRFCLDCNNCHNVYLGVTLPRDYQNIEAMWFNDLPVELFSSWREWQHGISSPCECGLAKYDLPGSYSTERDIFPAYPKKIGAHLSNPADAGKKVTIRGKDAEGVERVEVLTLKASPQFTTHELRSIAKGTGVTKARTAGSVLLADEDGRVLSKYAPDETVPGYRRIKITGLNNCDRRVNIRGSRRFFPVYNETDVVETNNRMAFEELARFLRINDQQNKSGSDLQAAAGHMAQAMNALLGEKSRDTGKATNTSLNVIAVPNGPRRLGCMYR